MCKKKENKQKKNGNFKFKIQSLEKIKNTLYKKENLC